MKKFYLWIFALLLISSGVHADSVADSKGRGFKAYTEDQIQDIQENTDEIIGVNPNKIGKQRIDTHIQSRGLLLRSGTPAISPDEEFITVKGRRSFSKAFTNDLPLQAGVLPSAVNNSTLPSFPPIGDQRALGSCVAWASTYYQASHELGLLNGYNNKTSTANVLSPKWTYNTLNEGYDGGLYVMDAYTLLNLNGAPSIASFPYDNNYLQWDLNTQDWISALSNRFANAQLVSGIGGSNQDLTTIKQMLNNGHVLTFATYVDSWVYGRVGTDPNSASNPYAGQLAVTYMNGYNGGHCITIVGYDDNVWIDINKNGKVDAGEKGAFLIANSWGTSWGNSGFVWISYDAFLSRTAVQGGPNTGRVPLAAALNSDVVAVVPKAANYKPSLIAQFSLSQSIRNQIGIGAGSSTTATTTPQRTIQSSALSNKGGTFEFDGSRPTTPQTGVFALDLTDLVQGSLSTSQRYYFILKDTVANNPTVLNSFTLIDKVNNKQVSYGNSPITIDNSRTTPYIEYSSNTPTPPPPNPTPTPDVTPPVVSLTYPSSNSTVQGTVQVTANASDIKGIARVDFYVDSVLKLSDTAAPYIYSWDTTTIANGPHTLVAIAYDTSNNSAQSSVTVQVQNSTTPRNYYINAGGGPVGYAGVNWASDQYFSGGNLGSTTAIYASPVYKTERWGNFSYTVPVSNGTYIVTLKFAEIAFTAVNKRVFNVAINNARVISNLDLYRVAGNRTYDLSYYVTVTNGQIKIDFTSVINFAKISGIQITKL